MWTTAPAAVCPPHSAADIQTRMEKYLVDAPPLRQSRPSDYRCDATTEHDDDDDDVGGGGGGRVTPAVHVHDLASLRPGTATLPDIKPLGSISDVLDLHKEGGGVTNSDVAGSPSGLDAVVSQWRHPLPPRAHSHNGFSSSESSGVTSPPPLPLSRGLSSVVRHDPPPPSLLDRFRPATTLGVAGNRFSELAVNGLPPHATSASMEPVSMTARRPATSRSQLAGAATTKSHRAIKCYHCRMCEQEFANKSDMQRHAKEAHRMEEKGHKCGQCLKTFPSSQQLTQHSLVHSNVRKYACAYCDKAFKQLSHVQQHQRIHTGERPYQCPVDGCSKAFRQLSSLQQHLKGHNMPLPKSYPVSRPMPPPPPPSAVTSSSSGSPSSVQESSAGNKLNSSLARPHDLTCQVCEKHCVDEVRFFCHIHKYHPDYWRVFSGGRPLSDFIETTSPESEQSSSPPRRGSPGSTTSSAGREKRYSCSVCHKRYCNQTGYVKHMAVHPGLADDLLRAGDGDAARMALYNCVVCSKLFTKEAYLLRHMEMKLDPAHAVGLEQLKKSSAMFRSSTQTTTATAASSSLDGACRPSSYAAQSHASRTASVDDCDAEDDRVASSPGAAGMPATAPRYVDDSRPGPLDALRRSTSCVSPLSTSSASPVSPSPMTSFMPYSSAAVGRDEPRRVPSAAFMPDADVLRYPHPIASAAAAAAAAADYHLRRGIVDGYTHSPSSYRAAPPPRSPAVDDDVQPRSSPEADDGRRSFAGPERRRHDYYTSTSLTFNRFQPYATPPPAATSSSGPVTGTAATPPFVISSYRPQYSFYRADDTRQPPPHLSDTYLRRSSTDLDDRRPVHGFR